MWVDLGITAVAIVSAPLITLWVQKKLETFRKEKQRKLYIFRVLMGTRANITSLDHVQALNMIDIEFCKEKKIRDLWNMYRDHLNSYPQNQNEQDEKNWEEKRVDYLTDLLHGISEYLNYDFDKVILKKGAYSPRAHGWLDLEHKLIRKGLVELLNGDKSIKVNLLNQEQLKKPEAGK